MRFSDDGVVVGMPEELYHAHQALSSTGARLILDAPAKFQYAQTHPRPPRREFDLGHAVHAKVLGVGAPTVVIPEDLLASNGAASTTAAREFIEIARAKGQVPVKQETYDQVDEMAESVLADPEAQRLLGQRGTPEASVFAVDPETGVELRARFDFLPEGEYGEAVDLKTTAGKAHPTAFARAAYDHGYEVQDGHYRDVLQLATGRALPMKFVVVETEPPYLVCVNQLDRDFTDMGAVKAKRAREIYAHCITTGSWPGYRPKTNLVQPPMYGVYDFQDNYA